MIPNEEKKGWHYPAIKKKKKLLALLRGIMSKHHRNFCLNCLILL